MTNDSIPIESTDLAPAGSPAVTFRLGFISLMAAIVGLSAGVIAYGLYSLIGLVTNLAFYHTWSFHFRSPQATHLGPLVILVPLAGGLAVGLMAKYGSEKIRGHGIPEAMEAVLASRSRIEARVAILKPLSAAIAIGTGGPFGAEGPIIQTGGAFGSLVGQIFSTTAAERKVLLACGGGAGLAATFNAPITGVILAIELLLFEFRARSFIPVVLASAMAVAVRLTLFGDGPMFHIGVIDYGFNSGLPWYLLLGVLCGLAAVGFGITLRKLEGVFDHWKSLPGFLHPAVGALGLGIVGFFLPRVLGSGYDTIDDILNARLALTVLLLVLVFKAFVVLLSLGSGTSGGTLAPMFMISAALGGTFAVVVNHVLPNAHLSVSAYAVAAMGALLSASARATFTFMFCAFETTHDFHAMLPIMVVCIVADAVAYLLLPDSIMTQRLTSRRGLAVPGDYAAPVLKLVRVGELMRRDVTTIPPEMTVSELTERVGKGEEGYDATQGLPIVDGDGRLAGIITQGDLLRSLAKDVTGQMTVREADGHPLVVTYADELAYDALHRMLKHNLGRMPVVDRVETTRLVGYLNRASFLNAWTREISDETVRETGWLGRARRGGAKASD
jgi:H+/Cl- antiporter ClcA/predicted transcriptional regulator